MLSEGCVKDKSLLALQKMCCDHSSHHPPRDCDSDRDREVHEAHEKIAQLLSSRAVSGPALLRCSGADVVVASARVADAADAEVDRALRALQGRH
jgi:hypothetical protein